MWNFSASLIGHVNWQPATLQAPLIWKEKTFDQDANFRTVTVDYRGMTAGNFKKGEDGFLGLEFDTREVLNSLRTFPWAPLWQKVKQGDIPATINAFLTEHTSPNHDAPLAILVGLFGVDCEHFCHAELHPIYAIAAQLNPSSSENVWGIFVRNWGNEGFCANGQENLMPAAPRKFRLLLPRSGTQKPTIDIQATKFASNNSQITFPSIDFVKGKGVLLTFSLPAPTEKGLAEFELHMSWPESSKGSTAIPLSTNIPTSVSPDSEAGPHDVEEYLTATFANAPQIRTNMELEIQQQSTTVRSTLLLETPRDLNQHIKVLTAISGLNQPTNVQNVVDAAEQRTDELFFEDFCRANNDNPPNLPTDACQKWRANRDRLRNLLAPSNN